MEGALTALGAMAGVVVVFDMVAVFEVVVVDSEVVAVLGEVVALSVQAVEGAAPASVAVAAKQADPRLEHPLVRCFSGGHCLV